MELSELRRFAYQKFGLNFQPAIPGESSMAVLHSPRDNSWFAVLSRFRVKGAPLWTLDIKCGAFAATIRDLPGFSSAYRLHDGRWVGIVVKSGEADAIKKALIYAFNLSQNDDRTASQSQYLFLPGKSEDRYQAQKIDYSGLKHRNRVKQGKKPGMPPRIKKMLAAYDYSVLPAKGRAKNFYRQGTMMADFRDDFAQRVPFMRFYPVYHDMNVPQLRTYFTWRAALRRGNFYQVSESYAYVYVYELLGNIGVNKDEGLKRLTAFRDKYAGQFGPKLVQRISEWLRDYALYYRCPNWRSFFAGSAKKSHAYEVLLAPQRFKAEEVSNALQSLGHYRFNRRLAKKKQFPDMLAAIWRRLRLGDFFFRFVGRRTITSRTLFTGAVFYEHQDRNFTLKLNEQLSFNVRGRLVYQSSVQANRSQKTNVNLLLHECDRLLRKFWHLGRPLKPRGLAEPYLKQIKEAVIGFARDQRRKKLQVNLDLSKLGQIRANAAETRESLLTEEEKEQAGADQTSDDAAKIKAVKEDSALDQEQAEGETADDEPDLSASERFVLVALLKGQDFQQYLRKKHLMASLLIDQINAKMLDVIGDSVIDFTEDGQPRIIEDYRQDLEDMFLKEK